MATQSRTKQDLQEQRPPQHQERQPGREHEMEPRPQTTGAGYRGSGRVAGKAAIITGGDSGIGRATAVAFAREGASVAIVYLEEDEDAQETKRLVEAEGGECLLIKGDIGDEAFCRDAVEQAVERFGRLDVLINNAAEQHAVKTLEEIDERQLTRTFRTNIFSMFYLTKAALPHLRKQEGSSIINTTSITAYRGSDSLLDYSSSKGAITAFTRSLSKNLAKEGIRVNGVAPGPIWTPLIPASFPEEKVESFGGNTPMGRAGQPEECAGCYVFLASDEASYMSGQVLHPNGGTVING